MLFDRIYEPADGDILYHYCSAETLLAICTNKTLRFCDLYSMNDFMEMHWGYHIWEAAASQVIDVVGKEFLDDIDEIIHNSGMMGLPLATCFSTEGDVLSQWRAYSQDGTGYAVGFRATSLLRLPVRPLRVLYDKDKQIKEIAAFVSALHEVESEAQEKRGSDFFQYCAMLSYDLAALKNPAFSEEHEVRLIHLLNFERSNDSLRLVSNGGTAFGEEFAPQKVMFRMKESAPVAYLDIDFSNGGQEHPIAEVIIGPKNESLASGVSVFLETLGVPGVAVRKSKASYR